MLYVAILSTVAGLSIKTATVLSRFMVTAVSLSNVPVFLRGPGPDAGGKPLTVTCGADRE